MAYIRGQERFVYELVFAHLKDRLLNALDWGGTTLPGASSSNKLYPWGAIYPITFDEMVPDPKLMQVDPNTIAFTEGRMPTEVEEELGADGGGLVSTEHTFFVDIYGESASIARAIGGDVRGLLLGRFPDCPHVLRLPNYAVAGRPPLAGHLLHFEDVELDFPGVGTATKLHWAVVKLTAVHEYNG